MAIPKNLESVWIVSENLAQAQLLRESISLRGVEEINPYTYTDLASASLSLNTLPAVMVWDWQGNATALADQLRRMPKSVKNIVLTDAFDEAAFVACHDANARDFLVKPVEDAYLLSRILLALNEYRLEQLVSAQNEMLIEMGVVSATSGLLTTQYFLKQLKRQTDQVAHDDVGSLSLVLLECQSAGLSASSSWLHSVSQQIKNVIRSQDLAGELSPGGYAILLPNTSLAGAQAFCKRLLQNIQTVSAGEAIALRHSVVDFSGCQNYELFVKKGLAALVA